MAEQHLISRFKFRDCRSDITEKILKGFGTKHKSDAEAYLQGIMKGISSENIAEIEQTIQDLEAISLTLKSWGNDSYQRTKRTETGLALNELCIQVANVLWAATLDTAKEEVDLRVLMTHSLHGH